MKVACTVWSGGKKVSIASNVDTEIYLSLYKLMIYINTIMTVYYEKAPSDATYPYGVVPDLTFSPLDYGYQCLFDVDLHINELSNSSVEQLCDNLRKSLDGYNYKDENIGFHIGFNDQYLGKMTEQDSSMRSISFIARIF